MKTRIEFMNGRIYEFNEDISQYSIEDIITSEQSEVKLISIINN